MWYFGTNLDNRFSVPGFWPKPEQTYKIPYDREEIAAEVERMRKRRLERRRIRLEDEAKMKELEGAKSVLQSDQAQDGPKPQSKESPTSRGILSYIGYGKGSSSSR